VVDTYIIDKDGNQANASEVTVPANRDFRGAWSLSGTVINEDLDKAKEIFRDKIREIRAPLLEKEDVVYMKAIEADDASAKTASVTKKNALRDAPAASAIGSASTIAELKAAWDTDLLGASPYA
tara:strand:- start:837 stop:1208 length:372 start_codon:yes stop_codon:yes gene_type:complete